MANLKIRLVKKDEFQELMNLMNTAFDFKMDEAKFEHILPKLYFKENKDMIHYGAFLDGKMVASIGLYTMTFVSKYTTLKVGCVGAVSTHPDYRKNGYFSMLMGKIISYAKKHEFDTLFLGGNRFRYNHFGFENAGRKLIINISKRTKHTLKPTDFEVIKLERDNVNDIRECLNLYNKQTQHVSRRIDNFYDHIITWDCEPYVVKVSGKIVGYYAIKNNHDIFEFVFVNKYLDTMLAAALDGKDEVYIMLPYTLYSNELLRKVDSYSVEHNEMHQVLNWDKVKKYLGYNYEYEEEFNKLSKREKVRALLGCNEYSSKFCELDMFIYRTDQG